MIDRKSMREQLIQRTQQEVERKSNMYGDIFKDIEIVLWREKAGKHVLDILPYVVGENDPVYPKGCFSFRFPVLVHRKVGVNEDDFVCPIMYKRPCPICEHRKYLRDSGVDKDIYKEFFPKRRSLFNVLVQNDDKEYKKGVQVWNISDYFGWDNISSILENPIDGGKIPISDPDDGKSVAFEREEKGKGNVDYKGFQLLERGYSISDEQLAMCYSLDELIVVPNYDELKEIFLAGRSESSMTNVSGGEDATPNRMKDNQVPEDLGSSEQTKVTQCPLNYNFGYDFDLTEKCKGCGNDSECKKEFKKIQEERNTRRGTGRRR